jgi:perosamine synthetase
MDQIRVSEPSLTEAEASRVAAVLARGWITQGEEVSTFEQSFAEHLDVPASQVVACSSGTAALHLALAALGVGPGDEVLVPDLTYVATANAVRYVGATPILVDVDPVTWTIDLHVAPYRMSHRTQAILPVHLYGVPCDMSEIHRFARGHGLKIIEDAAEAVGGSYQGRACGTVGDAGTFSFYGNKVVTTGEGGAVVVRSDALANRVRHLRGQAMSKEVRFFHDAVGFNYRMTDLQAAVGVAQISRIDQLLEARREVVRVYQRMLGGFSPFLCELPNRVLAPWLFTLIPARGVERDTLAARLAEQGIETRPTFFPLHKLPMYASSDHRFPISSNIGRLGISLPTHPLMTPEAAERVARAVMENCA